MSWVKLDDQIWTHRKMLSVEPVDRLLYVWALCWSSQNSTDGLIPPRALPVVAFAAGCTTPGEAADRLVDAGLWALDVDGWVIHDYLDYQPSAAHTADVARKRAEAGRTGGKLSGEARREASGKQSAKQNASPIVARGLKQNRTPSRPVPSPPSLTSSYSSRLPPRGSGGDDDETTINTVLRAIGQRRHTDALAANQVRNTTRNGKRAHRQACVTDALADDELRSQAQTAIAANPDWTPEQVAAHLDTDEDDQRPAQPRYTCPDCGWQGAGTACLVCGPGGGS